MIEDLKDDFKLICQVHYAEEILRYMENHYRNVAKPFEPNNMLIADIIKEAVEKIGKVVNREKEIEDFSRRLDAYFEAKKDRY